MLGVAVAIEDRDPQQVTARGFILNNPHRKRWGFFFAWRCCCDRRSRPATGHRQGLYPQTLVAHATGVCSFWRSELLRRRCVRCRMRWNCRGVDRRRCSAITYDGQHAAIQSVLEGARSCLSTSKHVAVLVGIGPPCWWSRCAWHVLSDWR